MTLLPLLRILKLFSIPALAITLLGAIAMRRVLGGTPGPGTKSVSFEFGGRDRSYLIHVPASYHDREPVPLIVVLHGGGQSPASAEHMSHMSEKAEHRNFIVIYPSGTSRLGRMPTWNSGSCCAYAMNNHIDDVGFLRALIDKLENDYAIDPRRVFITGISNGGMMSYRVACELSDKVAAIAPVEGALDVACNPAQPVSVIIFHGTADHLVPFDGGSTPFQIGSKRSDVPVKDAVKFRVDHDVCASRPKREETSAVHTDFYSGCKDGTSVVLYAIPGGHHSWPGDPLTPQINATDTMLGFFADHPKP
jgi:polyhydroxybutyrate depolymerase